MSDSSKTYKPNTQLHSSTLYYHHRTYNRPDTFRGYIPITNAPALKPSTKLLTRIYMVYKFKVYHTVLCYIVIKAVCNISTGTVVRNCSKFVHLRQSVELQNLYMQTVKSKW